MKMILLGAFLGFGLIIPGVSCTTTAIIYNVYDDYIDLLKNFYKYKILKKHYKLLIGLLLGVVFTIICLNKVYNKVPILINSLFLCLMIEGFNKIIKEKKIKIKASKDFLKLTCGFVLIFLIKLFLSSINVSSNSVYYLLIVGYLTSFSFLVPGLSGGMIMMSFGVYFYFVDLFYMILVDFPYFNINDLLIVFLFGIFIILGIMINSKFINLNIKSFFVIGIIIGSIFLMFLEHLNMLNTLIDFYKYLFWIVIYLIFYIIRR